MDQDFSEYTSANVFDGVRTVENAKKAAKMVENTGRLDNTAMVTERAKTPGMIRHERNQRIIELAAAGASADEIRRDAGVTVAQIHGLKKYLGITIRVYSGYEEAIASVIAGTPPKVAAEEFSVNYKSLLRVCKRQGVSVKDIRRKNKVARKYTPIRTSKYDRNQEIISKYQDGMTLQQIGGEYGITRERVRQILAASGITPETGGAKKVFAERRAAGLMARDVHKAKVVASFEAKLARMGCTREQYAEMKAEEDGWLAGGGSPSSTPITTFDSRRNIARRMGYGWNLTLGEWWMLWAESGKWGERGMGGYCLCRLDTSEPFEIGNVEIRNGMKGLKRNRRDRNEEVGE